MSETKIDTLSKQKLDYMRRQRTKEMRHQLVSFGMMIFMTFIAFGLAALDFSSTFIIPIVIVLAFSQVILQFYYFMHVKDKGHDYIKLMMLTGFFLALSFVVTFIYIVWIGKPPM
jgi:cytochrome c oxidase subunit 4